MSMASALYAASIAANIRDGKNPEFTVATFRELMPAFTAEVIPDAVLSHFVETAHRCIKEARWHGLWREGMRLFIAHFATLYLETPEEGADRAGIASAGKLRGAMNTKTVGPISVGYSSGQEATSDLTGWGAWKLTTYGTQFATLARMVGKGGMYIR